MLFTFVWGFFCFYFFNAIFEGPRYVRLNRVKLLPRAWVAGMLNALVFYLIF